VNTLNKPQAPARSREISGELATQARYALAENLAKSTFWFTFCPEVKAAHVGEYPGRQCSLCGTYHAWLELTRDDVKKIGDKVMLDKVADFVDAVNNGTLTTERVK
jgi:hypothetical protein